MRKLWILYDERCGMCCQVRRWAARQPTYVELEFLASGSERARSLFPTLATGELPPEELIVVSDEGGVYRGGNAYVMCLYALKDYREWSFRISTPELFPYAKRAFHFLTRNRQRLSKLLHLASDAELGKIIEAESPPACNVKNRYPDQEQRTVCPFCKDRLADRPLIRCAQCLSDHHRDCWFANGGNCSIFGCVRMAS